MFTRRGFTLLELLIVIVIIGILSTVALPNFSMMVEKAKVNEAKGVLQLIYQAERMYKLDQAGYGTLTDLVNGQYVSNPNPNPNWSFSTSNITTTTFTATATRRGGGTQYNGKTVCLDEKFNTTTLNFCGDHPRK